MSLKFLEMPGYVKASIFVGHGSIKIYKQSHEKILIMTEMVVGTDGKLRAL